MQHGQLSWQLMPYLMIYPFENLLFELLQQYVQDECLVEVATVRRL